MKWWKRDRRVEPPRPDTEEQKDEPDWSEAVVELPIDGILDLHTFNPKEVKDLVPEYIRECRKRGVFQLRIIHGKGRGVLLRTVHAILSRSPEVKNYRLATPESGGWGATLVDLHQPPDKN
ncbi:MAG: Smr/MutS family protein [Deltaproteobacteria bacterium]|nr:Smr/MutS family protein [Deltaproteobacteria bacterium]